MSGEDKSTEGGLRMSTLLHSHGARPVHLIITMVRWIRTIRLSTTNSLSGPLSGEDKSTGGGLGMSTLLRERVEAKFKAACL